ncbi:MAG: hypothetical protein CL878_11260 [Dehalococcoidia bacterium]|nr:hypothetical protein [Dehalococcoidia bacterium]
MTTEGHVPPAVEVLPPGWSVAPYASPGGQDLYAVYVAGRREVSGLPSVESAWRWVTLLSRHRGGAAGRDLPVPLPWPELSTAPV